VREAYRAIAAREPRRVRIVDATRPEAEVAAAVAAMIDGVLAGLGR
jgi:thymidylate kinase